MADGSGPRAEGRWLRVSDLPHGTECLRGDEGLPSSVRTKAASSASSSLSAASPSENHCRFLCPFSRQWLSVPRTFMPNTETWQGAREPSSRIFWYRNAVTGVGEMSPMTPASSKAWREAATTSGYPFTGHPLGTIQRPRPREVMSNILISPSRWTRQGRTPTCCRSPGASAPGTCFRHLDCQVHCRALHNRLGALRGTIAIGVRHQGQRTAARGWGRSQERQMRESWERDMETLHRCAGERRK